MNNNERLKTISKDIRQALEDIQSRLNTLTPQQCYDDLVPIIEDLDILEQAAGANGGTGSNGPMLPDSVKGNDIDTFISNMMAGVVGPAGPIHIETLEESPSTAAQRAYDNVLRLEERLRMEAGLVGNVQNPIHAMNVMEINRLMGELRLLTKYLNDFITIMDSEVIDDDDDDMNT